jgi:hypothetical protein
MAESPVFTKTHDLLAWLLTTTRKFPREQRFVLAARLQNSAFELQAALTAAGQDHSRTAAHLLEADIALALLRKHLLLCEEMKLITSDQYRHASNLTGEVGRLLGAWRKRAGATDVIR